MRRDEQAQLMLDLQTYVRNERQAAERKLEERDRKIVQRIKSGEDALEILRVRMELLEARVTALEALTP